MYQIDNQVLLSCITQCFNLSMNGSLPLEKRQMFFALGKRLRGSLVDLLTASFNDLQEVNSINRKITELNTKLQADITSLEELNSKIEEVIKVVGMLDQLLLFAARLGL